MSDFGGRIDLDALTSWMDDQGLSSGPIESVEMLAGGTQNVLLRFERGGEPFVLRRGPWHLRPKSNDMMRREMRVLAALAGSDVPHPGLIAACPDESVLGGDAVFYLMEAVDGFNPTVELPALHRGDEKVRHAMGLSAADAIAALGAIDHVAVGLDGLGRPDGFLERQVPQWLDHLDGYARFEGYPGLGFDALDEVAGWLEAERPTTSTPGIMHGDFHFANLLFRCDGPDVAAVVDWEMCTIGDPLLDLGWLLATWPDADEPGMAGPLAAAGGLATSADLVASYAERSDRDLSAVAWYEVLACFKLGIVIEGTHARAYAGKAPVEIGELLHATALVLLNRALRRIHGG
jgi:aminoglycoside phosphotransferase (APT) family kinase protein